MNSAKRRILQADYGFEDEQAVRRRMGLWTNAVFDRRI